MAIEQQRVSTGQFAKAIREEGYVDSGFEDPLRKYYKDPHEALQVWDITMKHERFAIMADLVDKAVTRSEIERGQTRIYKMVGANPYESLSSYMKGILTKAIGEEIDYRHKLNKVDPGDPQASIYCRFLDWVEFHNKYIIETDAHRKCGVLSPKEAITPGIDAATNWMGLVLKMVPKVYKSANPEDIIDIPLLVGMARRSYPLLGKLASSDIVSFNCIGFTIAGLEDPDHVGEIDPNAFSLAQDKMGLRLDFSEVAKVKIAEEISRKQKEIATTPRVGCPALINFGDSSPVAKLWERYLGYASDIYSTVLS